MKKVLIIDLSDTQTEETVHFLGQNIHLTRIGCNQSIEQVQTLLTTHDGHFDAIGLDGLPATLELGPAKRPHAIGQALQYFAKQTPVVDGQGIRASLERWGVTLADRAEPGIFSQKRILMVPGVNHNGLARALERRGSSLTYADPFIYFGLPSVPGVGSRQTLSQVAGITLDRLKNEPFTVIHPPAGLPDVPIYTDAFESADVLAGDIGAIRRFAPPTLKRKTIVVDRATEEDAADLAQRGASILVTLMPTLREDETLGRWSTAVIEAILVALRKDASAPLTEDTYLDLLAEIEWTPAIRYLQPEEANINRFSFVIHPLNVSFIHKHPWFRWTRYLPDSLVEAAAAYIPPIYISRITGGQSPTTGQRIEGYLYSLGATPRQMMKHGERFTYNRLNAAARMSQRKGARIMGLGAFTSVVGDAGITVAHESDIAITSGNSLTVAATLEAAKQAVIKMGATDLTKGKAMVIGATGSIGSVCARLIAQAIFDVVLVSIEPERLIELKRTIQAETPGAKVAIATKPDDHLGDCDLIITATSAFGQRIIDITKCKPGAVICDVARPPDISEQEAALRPDVLVIESGEVLIPGDINFGYDIGLPPGVAYACLAETALLAMEGRFEDYTLGRNITIERVKEIYRLFKKHQFQLSGLRSFDKYLTEEDLAHKRALAEEFRRDPELFAEVQAETAVKLAKIPVMAKGVPAHQQTQNKRWAIMAGVLALLALLWRRQSGQR